jgi:hypothetical protein
MHNQKLTCYGYLSFSANYGRKNNDLSGQSHSFMQKYFLLLALMSLPCTSVRAQQSYQQNPETFSVNRLPAHATLYRFGTELATS